MRDELNPYEPPEAESVRMVQPVERSAGRQRNRRPWFWLLITFLSSIVLGGLITAGADGWKIIASLLLTVSLFLVTSIRFRARQ